MGELEEETPEKGSNRRGRSLAVFPLSISRHSPEAQASPSLEQSKIGSASSIFPEGTPALPLELSETMFSVAFPPVPSTCDEAVTHLGHRDTSVDMSR